MASLPLPGPRQAADGAEIASVGHATPDLGPVLNLVLDAVASPETKRHYARALVEFATWRAAHRLPFHRATVQAWRNSLQDQQLSPSSINQKLAAVRKLAEEAAANRLLDAETAAQIERVPGARQTGNRMGMWLTQAQAQALIEAPAPNSLKGKRDRAALALLVGCGLRREEAVRLTVGDIQMREARWVIADLRGKHGRVRTVPVPAWVKAAVDHWTEAAQIQEGRLLRAINRHGRTTHASLSGQAVWGLAAQYGRTVGVQIGAHDLRRTCARLCRKHGGELEQIQMLLGHASIETTERYLGTRQDLTEAPNDRLGLKWREA